MNIYKLEQSKESQLLKALGEVSSLLTSVDPRKLIKALDLSKAYLEADSVRFGQIIGSRYVLMGSSESQIEDLPTNFYLENHWCRVTFQSDLILDQDQLLAGNVVDHPSDKLGEFKGYLGASINAKKVKYGTVAALYKSPRKFSEKQRFFLKCLSNWLGGYVNQMQLRSKLQDFSEEIDISSDLQSFSNQEIAELKNDREELLKLLDQDLILPANRLNTLLNCYDFNGSEKERNLKKILLETVESIEKVSEKSSTILDFNLHLPEVEPEPFSLHGLVLDLFRLLSQRANENDVELEFMSSQDVKIYSDPIILHEILMQVILNAIKFSPKNSKVTLEIIAEHEIEIWIHDQGPGIPEAYHQEIFEKFKTLNNQPEGIKYSAGIGLYIAKEFAKLLNVRFQIHSKPGKTEFGILIPKTHKASFLKKL